MRIPRVSVLALLAAVALWSMSGTAAAAQPSYYLAIGDSVTVATGATSYPHLLRAHYLRDLPTLQLDDLGTPGATTGSVLTGGQYAAGVAFLKAHRGHVALITVDLGGNDYAACYSLSGVNEACAAQALTTIRANLTKLLAGLRRAAVGVPVIGMNYYNPFVGYWLSGGVLRQFALSTVSPGISLNLELTSLYGGPKKTADVEGAFAATDMTTIVSSPWGEVPVSVDRACSWLDLDCQPGVLAGFGLDPNPAGEAAIASAFERTIGTLCAPGRALIRGRCRLVRR